MPRRFNLAGLLRLRHMQEDSAAAALAAANGRMSRGSSRSSAVRAALGESETEVSTAAGMAAMAASRASSVSMLADLRIMTQLDAEAVQQAEADFMAARAKSKGLEKLHEKHQDNVAADDLAAEQIAVDEIASGTWHRKNAEVTL